MKKPLFFILIASCMLCGCEDQPDFTNGVPNFPVSINIAVASPQFVNISVVGGYEQVTGGSRGIGIYRLTLDEFIALDRHCTFEPENECGVAIFDPQDFVLRDDCCGSEFQVFSGAVLNGPATLPLRRYQTSFDGSTLRIFN